MPRRSELLEEERNYRLVKREKEESGALVKQVLRFLFSQVGVVILGVITAVLGNVCNQTNSGVSGCVQGSAVQSHIPGPRSSKCSLLS